MRARTMLKILYEILGIAALGVVLTQYDPKTKDDIGIILGYLMIVLSFPVSLLVLAFLGFVILPIGTWLEISIEFGYTYIVLYWGIFFVAGYWQWFVLVPWLWRKFRPRAA